MTAGGVSRSVDWRPATVRRAVAVAALVLGFAASGYTDTLYKYRTPEGQWVFSDRPPAGDQTVETRELSSGVVDPEVIVSHHLLDRHLQLAAENRYYAPVELVLGFVSLQNAVAPGPDQPLRFILPPQSETDLFAFAPSDDYAPPEVSYKYIWLVGDPTSKHAPSRPYRAPFAVAGSFPVTQAFPDAVTHTTADSRYAVDISMPIGTDVYAARGGTVFEVASTNFRGGLDPAKDAAAANLVRILHDDGTYAVYAHLNWNSIRVRPGDVVSRGEYIADSGNTGFTSGPHLHFAILRNRGLGIESVPVVFEGPDGEDIVPQTGVPLAAW